MNGRLVAFACLTACAVGPDYKRPPPPVVERFANARTTVTADGVAQQMRHGAELAATWWQLFENRPLDALVRTALANNQSIAAARANVRRSAYQLRAGYGVFLPQVDAVANLTKQRFNPAQFGAATPPSEFAFYSLAGTISYTLDVFGGNRRSVEALRAQLDMQCFSLAAAQLTVTGNVVNTAIARAAYAEEIRATEALVADLQKQVDIARVQATAGTGPYSTVLSLETQRANTAATIPPLRQQYANAEHLLAATLGYVPTAWRAPTIALADFRLPRELPVSLPAQLVRQRPDVLVAEATLHIASANIGVATAAMLPQFTLSSDIGSQARNIGKLFSYGSFVWNFGVGLLAPLFHGGTLNAQRKAAIEDFRSSLAAYRNTVLGALSDVATTVENLVEDARSVEAHTQALVAATESRKLVGINYENGVAGYLDVLVADTQYRQALISLIQARAKRLQDTVTLFVALGGGWWKSRDAACAGRLAK